MSRSKSMFAIVAATATVFALSSVASADRGTQKTISGNAPTPSSPISNFAEASHTIPSFSQTVTSTAGSLLLTGIPAGTYTSYSVSLDWAAGPGDPWSSEGIWALTDAPLATATTFYADPGPSSAALDSGAPVHLTWSGPLDVPYTAPADGSLYFLSLQTFGGSSANWSNISITLNDSVVSPPSSTATVLGGSISAPLAASAVQWYSFSYSGAGAISLDTTGSTLTPSTFGEPNDTEIALYSSAGALIETNDDIDFAGGVLTSGLSYTSGELPAGTYYVAVTGFNGAFAGGFGATSTSISTGTIVLNGLSVVPEPTSLAALGMISLIGRRRRA